MGNGINGTNTNKADKTSGRTGSFPAQGGCEKLPSYSKAAAIYDATVRFCERFVDRKSRTHDHMIQSARGGHRNISEASQASGASKESELKFTNAARANLEELLGNYHDFLRQHGHEPWDKISKEALYVRQLGRKPGFSYNDIQKFVELRPPEVVANIVICLIHQANYLLDQQIRGLERNFPRTGAPREPVTRTGSESRDVAAGPASR